MLHDSTVPRPLLIAHADWSSNPKKRWMAQAALKHGRYIADAPELVDDTRSLLQRLHTTAGGHEGAILVGFDFPIGLPAGYAERVGVDDFVALLPKLGHDEWSNFYEVADHPDQISLRRPFYPQSSLPKGSKKQSHLLEGLNVKSMNELRRRCDRVQSDRRAAAPIFWLVGGNQVGKAAIAGWKEVLVPALLSFHPDVAIWPFDGELAELLEAGRVVIVETYPTEFYRHLGIILNPGKRSQEARQRNADVLLRWADNASVELSHGLQFVIEDGFGETADGEDRFDATVGLFGMLNVVLGNHPTGEPLDNTTRRVEGWMFGQLADPAAEAKTATQVRTGEKNLPETETFSEYDPLASLYDLEYSHDHDVPFWLSLAEREGGPIVEWGAGTGRLAIPLAEAGFEVTAVELSKRMVEVGRKKGGTVEWVRGDMRTAKLGRRYALAVCAFNSLLCLPSVDDTLAYLRNAREHLEPGGLLGIEVSAFTPEELVDPPGGPELHHDFTRELPGGRLDRSSVSRYDAASQLLAMRLFYELYRASGELEDRRAHDLTIRVVGRAELELMLRLAGFEVEAVYGGFEGEPFTAGSDRLIVLTRNG
jgi:SAM-dependent methyltransferase